MTLGTSTQANWEPSYWDERYIKYSDALRLVPELCRPCFHSSSCTSATCISSCGNLNLRESLCQAGHPDPRVMPEGGKLGSQTLDPRKWELTGPIPLNEDSSSVNAVLGENPDVHYICVCIKDESKRLESKGRSLNTDEEES